VLPLVCPQRPPAKRGPAVVSLAFTGLALAPLGLLVIYLGLLGFNLKVHTHSARLLEWQLLNKCCVNVAEGGGALRSKYTFSTACWGQPL
jgi:hypothetical protein